MGKGLETVIKPEEYFVLRNGRVLKNLYELVNALKSIDQETFMFHANEQKNDFGNWVRDAIKDIELADSIFNSRTKEGIIEAVESRIYNVKKIIKRKNHNIREKGAYLEKIEEVLVKEKEIEKREEKIEEIEAKIEKELGDLAAKKEPKFFTREFLQGLLIGLLTSAIAAVAYIRFFA